MIDENQLSSAHNILSTSTLEIKTTKTPPSPHNNRPKRLFLSQYRAILTSLTWKENSKNETKEVGQLYIKNDYSETCPTYL